MKFVVRMTQMKLYLNSAAYSLAVLVFQGNTQCLDVKHDAQPGTYTVSVAKQPAELSDTVPPGFDTLAYQSKMKEIANGDRSGRWPPTAAVPRPGSIFPFKRVVAYYGNFYCKQMGILGEFAPSLVLKKLKEQVKAWQLADTATPVVPAIHYIAVTAQSGPCLDYCRLRMPESEIRKAIAMADSVNGIVFLDIQLGLSTIERELPLLEKYLKLPNVHLGIDPEFSMKSGQAPGTAIGTLDGADVNYATSQLASWVKKYDLPPKILVVHRFTVPMLTGYRKIETRPEVQVVINMDGFGSPTLKKSSYRYAVELQPVQFTGIKLFYTIDVSTGGRLMQPDELLKLVPKPVYIQYQ